MSHHLASSALHEQTPELPSRRAPAFPVAPLTVLFALSIGLSLGGCTKKSSGDASQSGLSFIEFQEQAGVNFKHEIVKNRGGVQRVAGGVACGDYDNDGFPDLYVVGGDIKSNLLFHNLGADGHSAFEEVAKEAGVALAGGAWCSATFVHLNGDKLLDLFLGGVADTTPCILINQGPGEDGRYTFVDATPGSGLEFVTTDTVSAAFGDYDKDGDLDMFLTQWNVNRTNSELSQHLWRNDGNAKFTDVSEVTGITAAFDPEDKGFTDLSFTPNFVDINNDGYLDLLITGDLGTNKVLLNVAKGNARVFEDVTSRSGAVLDSEHASGAAIGDYDNDGDLDWYVAGVYHEAGSVAGPLTGNRLYRNAGDGTFEDVTDLAGVRQAGWGWAASFADFDNDGHLDLIQTNGFGTAPSDVFAEFLEDPSHLFMSNGDGTFTEQAASRGMFDSNQGRGVVCFDFDRDGDLDVFTANILGESRLWQNNLPGQNRNYLDVRLSYKPGNWRGIGSRVKITIAGRDQIREIRAGSHYVSQNDAEAHFGLNVATIVDKVEVTWPDGSKTVQENVPANQLLHIEK